jgi:hypothetical protein
MTGRTVASMLVAMAALAASACGSGSVNGPATGSHSSSGPVSSSPSGAARITLTLSGAPAVRFSACGSDKSFLTTGGSTPITAAGTLPAASAGGARVKLKVKQCQAGTWQTVTEAHVKVGAGGAFATMVPLPGPGAYTVRAYYYPGGATVRSIKGYVRVTG